MKLLSVLSLLCLACASARDDAREDAVARALVASCPVTEVGSVSDRDMCAALLADEPALRAVASDVMLWGGQPPNTERAEAFDEANLTEFHPLVWRRLYLSTFMFSGDYAVEDHPPFRVLVLPVRFRNDLPDGEYPYPFWHSAEKWDAYQEVTELLLYFREGRLVGALRSAARDPARATRTRAWDGEWRWEDGQQPRVTMFSYLFRAENEQVPALDVAYRALEEKVRESACDSCHAPSNVVHMRRLDILNYPAQALAARHTLMSTLLHNEMPPPEGIADERVRAELIGLAQKFVMAADAALAREDELADATK